jgi:hypothetical protein
MRGWSINLTDSRFDQQVELPCDMLFVTSQGPVVELVFWSRRVEMWIHAVGSHFRRELPPSHVQLAVGDLAWINQMAIHFGDGQALAQCVAELEKSMLPAEEDNDASI